MQFYVCYILITLKVVDVLNVRTALFYFRDFILHTMEFLHSEEEFVSSFMKASKEHYGRLLFPNNTATLSSKYVDASVAHTVHGLVDEVIKVICLRIKYLFICYMLVKVK